MMDALELEYRNRELALRERQVVALESMAETTKKLVKSQQVIAGTLGHMFINDDSLAGTVSSRKRIWEAIVDIPVS